MLRNYRGIVLNSVVEICRNPRNSLEFSAKKGQRPFIVPTGDRISSRYSFRKWHLLDEKLCSRLCFSWIVVQMEYLFSLDDEAWWRKMKKRFISVRIYRGIGCLILNQIKFIRLRKRNFLERWRHLQIDWCIQSRNPTF